jgi:hypothetical protein
MNRSVDTRFYYEWLEENKGKLFKRKKGTVVARLEDIWIDHSLERHYGFVWVYPKLRNVKTGKTVKTEELNQFRRVFEEVSEQDV